MDKIIRVAPTTGDSRGIAYVGECKFRKGERGRCEKKSMVFFLPPPTQLTMRRLARLFEHEAKHTLGLSHEQMTEAEYWSKGSVPSWARGLRVRWRRSGQQQSPRRSPMLQDLRLSSVTENGITFTTGTPVVFPFVRGTTPSPKPGPRDLYQQKIEPAGRYLLHDPSPSILPLRNWTKGVVHLARPLVLAFGPNGYDAESWKARLSRAFGRRGRALSEALEHAGYDGVVTVDRHGGTSEIVVLPRRAASMSPGGSFDDREGDRLERELSRLPERSPRR